VLKCHFLFVVDLTGSQVEEWEAALQREADQLRHQQQLDQQQESDSDETDSQQEQGTF
jgi:hypothetical protein